MEVECPNCGSEMEELTDWPGDWLCCPKCQTTLEVRNQNPPEEAG